MKTNYKKPQTVNNSKETHKEIIKNYLHLNFTFLIIYGSKITPWVKFSEVDSSFSFN